ncbi:MAG: hypothetical protein IPL49_15000 [Saprospirales bacterium]|nr:hypothetical protein [Saprospirales bacterium]
MKILRILIPSLALGLVLSLGSCSGGEKPHTHDESGHAQNAPENTGAASEAALPLEPHGEGPEYNSAYVCPMHCAGSGSDQPGVCPACGMDYVANAEHTSDGHKH